MLLALALFVLSIVDIYRTDTNSDNDQLPKRHYRGNSWNNNYYDANHTRSYKPIVIVDDALRHLMNKSKNIKISQNGGITKGTADCNTDASKK